MRKLYALGFYISILFLPAKIWGQYIVDFEGPGETKTGYASGDVNLSGLDWNLTEVLIGTSDADWKNGNRSVRLRGYGTSAMTMLENKRFGAGTISFLYRRYSTDAQVAWWVEYSVNDGTTWIQIGSDFTAPANDEVQVFTAEVNIPNDIRFRIRSVSSTGTDNRRLNIDDIVITNYLQFEVIDFDDDNKWTQGSAALNTYQINHSYEDQGWLFSGGEAMRQGTTLVNGFPGALGTYSWRLRDGNVIHPDPVDWRGTYTSRGIIEAIGFDVRRWNVSPSLEWIVDFSTDGGVSFSSTILTINNAFLDDSSDWKSFYYEFDSPLQVEPNELIVRIRRIEGERIMIDNFVFNLQECAPGLTQFRTVSDGTWFNTTHWEVFDGNDWVVSYCIPDSGADIVNIDHNIVIEENKFLLIENVVINDAGVLSIQTDFSRLDGPDAIVIESGGILSFDGGNNPFFQNNATVVVKSDGIIRIGTVRPGISDNVAGNNSSGKYVYENGAIFEWSTTGSIATINQNYFPDVDSSTIPIFRMNAGTSIGAGTPTTINGIFEANANVTWQNSGEKRFRNGITGTGTVTQAESSGKFIIDGNTAQLGVNGNLVLNGTGLEVTSPNLELISDKTISGSGPFILAGTLNAGNNTLSLEGNFFITDEGVFDSQTSSLIFNGTDTQTFQAADITSFYNLTLENPSNLLVESPVIVRNTLELSQGNIINENATVTLGISPAEPGELLSAEGFIKGIFRRHIPAEADTEWLFPIGRDQHEAPVKILFTSPPETGGILETEYITVIPDNFYGNLPIHDDDLIIDILFDAGFWRIQALQGLTDGVYNVSLGVSDTLQERIFDFEEVRILKRETPASNWAIAGTFGSANSEFITHINVETGFSEFAVGSDRDLNPLPIELLYFNAEVVDNRVNLFWATATETNNDFFTLERSADLRNIEIIGRKPGAGNSNTVLRYSYTDRNPHPGISYYRLKQTDYDGSFEYSDWVAVRVNPSAGNELEILRLFRHDGSVFLLLQTQQRSNLEIRVTDIYGREIHHGRLQSASGTARYSFVPNTTGLIFITVSDGQKRVSGRMIIR